MKNKKSKNTIIAIIIVGLIIAVIVLAVMGINALKSSLKQEADRMNEVVVSENGGKAENETENSNLGSNTSSNQISQNNVPKALEDNEDVKIWTDASGDQVPVPIGYVGSKVDGENEIDTGYVIYEGTADVTSSNVSTAKTTRNQYVWVPVPDVHEMYGTDENGKKWGKLYDFGSALEPEKPPTPYYWREENGVMTEGYVKEPDILTLKDNDSQLRTYNIGVKTMLELELELEKEFNRIIASTEKYGGFYIGRYETGDLNKDKAVVVKGNSDNSSKTWYIMYKLSKRLQNGNEHVRTSMIYGSQWDATLKWLIRGGYDVTDSRSWGNYKDSIEPANVGNGTKRETGYSEHWKANNIYDMAGNVEERTMAVHSNNHRLNYRYEL